MTTTPQVSDAQPVPSRISILARLVPVFSYVIPMLGAALSAGLVFRALTAMQYAESAGVAAVAGALAETHLAVVVALYLAIFVGFIGIVVMAIRSFMSTTTASPTGWFFLITQFDLSTDDGVNAACEAIAGKKIDDRSKRCISRDRSLPGMVIVGGFAFDYGCRFQGVFVNSRYVATEDKALSRSALEALGWKTANRELREKLAQAWLAKGLFAFVTVRSAKNEDFKYHSFQPPGAVTRETGETVVTLWIRLPSGRVRGRVYQLREYRFSSDGDFAGSKTVENFNTVKESDG